MKRKSIEGNAARLASKNCLRKWLVGGGGNTPKVPPVRHIVLIGLMASGKSTIGPALAARLGRPFLDNDAMLERRTGRMARDIEASSGLDELHADEARVLADALRTPEAAVIAAAAAAVLAPDAAPLLAGHDVVYLRAAPDTLAQRAAGSGDGHRPFAAGTPASVLHEQFASRDQAYRDLATVVVEESSRSPQEIVDEISSALSRP
jgi:shikimate kinase